MSDTNNETLSLPAVEPVVTSDAPEPTEAPAEAAEPVTTPAEPSETPRPSYGPVKPGVELTD